MIQFLKTMKIKHKITILASVIVIVILLFVGLVIERSVTPRFEEQLEDYAMSIAHTVAMTPIIKANVGLTDGHLVIQPLVEEIINSTDAEYIVVFDMNKIRYSHPIPVRIGQTFVGGDENEVLRGKAYTSRAVGTLGPSLRAFVPIYYEDKQVGAVAVGIMLTKVNTVVADLRNLIYAAIFFGLIMGIFGASFLAGNIKKSMLDLEPYQIASILKEREAILESVREGILAIDNFGKIILINNEARKILNLWEDVLGKDVKTFLPNTRLLEVIKSGQSEYDMEQNIRTARIFTNRVPIKVNNEVVGAIASFRDLTEIKALAQELSGVKRYVEALRVQNHEFSNKLHTILGLIQLGEYNKAISFISMVTDYHQDNIAFVTKRIKESAVGGLLLGKSGRCKELGIKFEIDKNSNLGNQRHINYNDLVVIIGNLLENAMEAVQFVETDRRRIYFAIFDESNKIFIQVKDSGVGISPEVVDSVFEKGFSTKAGDKRGFGLFLVKSLVDSYHGEISFESDLDKGTEFVIIIPNGVIS